MKTLNLSAVRHVAYMLRANEMGLARVPGRVALVPDWAKDNRALSTAVPILEPVERFRDYALVGGPRRDRRDAIAALNAKLGAPQSAPDHKRGKVWLAARNISRKEAMAVKFEM